MLIAQPPTALRLINTQKSVAVALLAASLNNADFGSESI